MFKLGLKGKTWLKGIHIFFVCAWMGAGISMLLLGSFKNCTASGDELYAMNAAIKLIDDYIVIPSAMGTLLTGLLFSLLTNWGFFKFKWITFKWITTAAQILFGTFFLGPWTNGAEAIANAERIQALQNPLYFRYSELNLYFGTLQVLLLVAVVFVSVFKPWKTKKLS